MANYLSTLCTCLLLLLDNELAQSAKAYQPTPAAPVEAIQADSPPQTEENIVPPSPEPSAGPWSDPEFLALFVEPTLTYSGRGYENREFTYRLFVPEITSPNQRLPLIVWLHGYGKGGDDNIDQLAEVEKYLLPRPWVRKRYPFFVLALQCPEGNRLWTTTSDNADDMVNVLQAALETTIREHSIDSSRISLVGLSSGGSGCWEMAMRHPEQFSGVAPLGSGGGDLSRINTLVGIPVWAFHCSRDRFTPPDAVRATVAALKAVGGSVELTEVNSASHNCWTAAFEKYGLLGWLVSRQLPQTDAFTYRLSRFVNGPALIPVAIPVSLLVGAIVAWLVKRRSSRRMCSERMLGN